MLHQQDIIDVSKCFWVTDFHGNAPCIPLLGAKCDSVTSVYFADTFPIKKGGFVYSGEI